MLRITYKDLRLAATAIAYLFCLVTFAVYSAAPWTLPLGARPQATSLRLIVDRSQVSVGETVQISILATSDDGRLDPMRDDLVEISVNPESRAKLSESRVNLTRGRGEVTLISDYAEPVVVTVTWISGRSTLRGDSALIRIVGRSS
jgi:hypothetical protein